MTEDAPPEVKGLVSLGHGRKGFKGVVAQVGAGPGGSAVDSVELERRLLEIGFVEGARVEILHVGLFGGDPLAIRLDDMRVALRRREAEAVLVRPDEGGSRARSSANQGATAAAKPTIKSHSQ